MEAQLRKELGAGAALFAAGEWWEAHEAWEGPWQRATGADRDFLQALILLAAALHKRWHHGSLTARNYHKAEKYLGRLPAVYAGTDLARLRAEVWEALHDPALRPQLRGMRDEGLEGGRPPAVF